MSKCDVLSTLTVLHPCARECKLLKGSETRLTRLLQIVLACGRFESIDGMPDHIHMCVDSGVLLDFSLDLPDSVLCTSVSAILTPSRNAPR